MDLLLKIKETCDFLRDKIKNNPRIAIILGTGLNDLAEMLTDTLEIEYADIPHFRISTAPSHKGRLISGKIGNCDVIVFQGRLHFYEGYPMEEVTYPVRIAAGLGVQYLFVTNAVGSLNPEMLPGQIVLLTDHINFMGTNPLIGKNYDELGERFPSFNEPYNHCLVETAERIAEENGIKIMKGVYVAVTGPSLETRAECKMFAALGADIVGMSTVPEVIVAVHNGLKVLAFSVVTNLSNIFHAHPHTQEEIRLNAEKASDNLKIIIKKLIESITNSKQ